MVRQRLPAAMIVLLSAVWWTLPLYAQTALDDLIGRTVSAVSFEVEGKPDTSQALLDLSDVRVGSPLRVEDWRATIAHLDALGRYEQVIPVATATPEGVEVVFRLVPRHPITDLEITGSTGLPQGGLRRLVQQRYGGVPTDTRLSAVESTVEQFLRDEGYLDAQVTATTRVTQQVEGATLVLDVRAGALYRIARVEVRGESPFSEEEIVQRTGTDVGAPYTRRAIDSALTRLEDELRLRGYYEAQVTIQPDTTPDGVALVITTATGPRVEVHVDPIGALPGSVEEFIPIRRLGSADQDLLEDSRARIEQALRSDGYWKASAPFSREVLPDGSVLRITFTITRGPRYFVEGVDLPSTLTLPAAVLRGLLAINRGDVFDEGGFLTGLAAVVDEYRRSGYYEVKAEPSYEEVQGGDDPTVRALVVLHPNITEGPRGLLADIQFGFAGTNQVPEAELREVMTSRQGQPYVELTAANDRTAIRSFYRNRGFLTADVAIDRELADEGRRVSLLVRVNEGQQIVIGQISVVGNERVSPRAILEEMQLEPGQPAGVMALNDAQRRLTEMGVFRRTSITIADQFTGEREAHLIVNVVEAPATSLGFGGGLEGGSYNRRAAGGGVEDRLEFAPRGFFEIGRRSLWGRNRSVSLFSRASLKRSRNTDELVDNSGFGFTEYRVTGTYREHRAFRSDTDLLLGLTSEQAVRTGFNYIRKSTNAEILRALSPRVNLSGRYALNVTRLLDVTISEEDRPLIDRVFPQVRLSILSSGVTWDRRDNLLSPTAGTLASADVEVATRALGSEVGYLKGFLQLSSFNALGDGARTVLATRAQVGLARGFPRTVEFIDPANPDGAPVSEVVEAVPVSQRFFAGGSTTVRGFQLDRLGVAEIINGDGLSLGGNGVLVLNAEFRRVVSRLFGRSLGAVAFLDGGNVFASARSLNLNALRGAAGFGLRYDSPLGPLRLDFGFKLDRRTFNGRPEKGWEYHLSIGEAF